MKLRLTGPETEVLTVHLHVMRKSIKSVLKRNYGYLEGKRLMKVYDEVKTTLKDQLEYLDENTEYPFLLNEEEIDLLYSFLQAFCQKVEAEMTNKIENDRERNKAKDNLKFDVLNGVKEKVTNLYVHINAGETVGV